MLQDTFYKMNNKFLLLIFSIVISFSGNSQNLDEKITQSLNSEVFENSFSGFALYDPQKEEMLYEYNSKKYFTPASNMKLFTFYAGVKILGDSIPALHYVVKNDSLIFWGTGDPSFLYEDLPESEVLNFFQKRDEKLFYFPAVEKEEAFGPGWAWEDYNYSFSAERAPFPIFGNYATFIFDNKSTKPKAYPPLFNKNLNENFVVTKAVERDFNSNTFFYNPFRDETWRPYRVPFIYSKEVFTELLSNLLKKPVEILPNPKTKFKNPKTVYSIPADSLYKQMLIVSDNFVAEQTLLLAAGEISRPLKSSVTIKHVLENFLSEMPDEVKWVDGSGLSRYNLVTPRSMVFLLREIQKEVPQERLFQLLPAGGSTGTLKNMFNYRKPFIHAKTGTLKNNYSLSGYLVAASGKVLIFSFMNSNYVVPNREIKNKMEIILEAVRKEY